MSWLGLKPSGEPKFSHFIYFWEILALFGCSWVKNVDWGHPYTLNWVEASAKTYIYIVTLYSIDYI